MHALSRPRGKNVKKNIFRVLLFLPRGRATCDPADPAVKNGKHNDKLMFTVFYRAGPRKNGKRKEQIRCSPFLPRGCLNKSRRPRKSRRPPEKRTPMFTVFYRAGASGLGLKQATGTLPKQKALDLKQEISRKSRK